MIGEREKGDRVKDNAYTLEIDLDRLPEILEALHPLWLARRYACVVDKDAIVIDEQLAQFEYDCIVNLAVRFLLQDSIPHITKKEDIKTETAQKR